LTRSAKATERILLRRVPGAEPGAPTSRVAEAVVAVKPYFEGEETDFSGFRLDLGEQDPFFERIYAAARRGRMGPHDDLWRFGESTRCRAAGRARCRSSHVQESGGADHPLSQGFGGRR
jgi:O6-methylguanine-DNA--protein-cysteine methyltransferase